MNIQYVCTCDNPELRRGRDVPQWSQLSKVTHKPVSFSLSTHPHTQTARCVSLILLPINRPLFNSLCFQSLQYMCALFEDMAWVFDDSHMMRRKRQDVPQGLLLLTKINTAYSYITAAHCWVHLCEYSLWGHRVNVGLHGTFTDQKITLTQQSKCPPLL